LGPSGPVIPLLVYRFKRKRQIIERAR